MMKKPPVRLIDFNPDYRFRISFPLSMQVQVGDRTLEGNFDSLNNRFLFLFDKSIHSIIESCGSPTKDSQIIPTDVERKPFVIEYIWTDDADHIVVFAALSLFFQRIRFHDDTVDKLSEMRGVDLPDLVLEAVNLCVENFLKSEGEKPISIPFTVSIIEHDQEMVILTGHDSFAPKPKPERQQRQTHEAFGIFEHFLMSERKIKFQPENGKSIIAAVNMDQWQEKLGEYSKNSHRSYFFRWRTDYDAKNKPVHTLISIEPYTTEENLELKSH